MHEFMPHGSKAPCSKMHRFLYSSLLTFCRLRAQAEGMHTPCQQLQSTSKQRRQAGPSPASALVADHAATLGDTPLMLQPGRCNQTKPQNLLQKLDHIAEQAAAAQQSAARVHIAAVHASVAAPTATAAPQAELRMTEPDSKAAPVALPELAELALAVPCTLAAEQPALDDSLPLRFHRDTQLSEQQQCSGKAGKVTLPASARGSPTAAAAAPGPAIPPHGNVILSSAPPESCPSDVTEGV